MTELNTKYTPYNFFTKPTLSILHQAIAMIVYFELFLVTGFIIDQYKPFPKIMFQKWFQISTLVSILLQKTASEVQYIAKKVVFYGAFWSTSQWGSL